MESIDEMHLHVESFCSHRDLTGIHRAILRSTHWKSISPRHLSISPPVKDNRQQPQTVEAI